MNSTSTLSAAARSRRIGVVAVVMISALYAGGCASKPRVVQSWKDPSINGPLGFKKIVVIVAYPSPTVRRIAEDELVQQIGPARAIHGDEILSNTDRGDIQKIKAKLKQSGADGVVTLRLAGATERTATSGGFNPYSYDSFWQNYDNDMNAAEASSATTYGERVVYVRTRIFRVADEKMVWEGLSESFDPKDARSLIDDVAKAVVQKLREEHLIE